jgi:hypothetical protein
MLDLAISLDTDSRGTTVVGTNTGMKLKAQGILRLEEVRSAGAQKGITAQ